MTGFGDAVALENADAEAFHPQLQGVVAQLFSAGDGVAQTVEIERVRVVGIALEEGIGAIQYCGAQL